MSATETATTLRCAVTERTATLTIDRPPLNVLDLATIGRLDRALAELASRDDLRTVLVRGAGKRAFSAGVAIEDHVPERIDAMLDGFHGALRRLLELDAVTVAVVRGHCLGGGMELAACCDLVIATDDARFGQPEITLACFPPLAAALYPRLLGWRAAADLVLTGRVVDAAEAERLGFVSRRVAPDELDAAVDELLSALGRHSTAALRLAKRALRAGRERPFDDALAESERIYREELARTADLDEGVQAFLSKRPPRWEHR